jgi:hypothetical protein
MKLISSVVFALLPFFIASAQNNAPLHIDSFDENCYCEAAKSTPPYIVQMDNNWELITALRQGRSLAQLDSSGIRYTKSQIALLQDWGLVRKDDETYTTSFPILTDGQTAQLRSDSRKLAERLVVLVKSDVVQLRDILEQSHRGRNTYTVLFSYILDNLVWKEFENDSLLPHRSLSVEQPFWTGVFWMVTPKRAFACGTNSLSDKGYSFKVNWTEKAIPKMIPFVSRWDVMEKLLNNLVDQQKVTDKEVKQVFGAYKFFDPDGHFTVPIISQNESDPVYAVATRISRTISQNTGTNIDFPRYLRDFHFNREQAIVILYHEVMWDMLDLLETQHVIEKPVAFRSPDQAKPEDIADLIIIVRE